MSENNLVEVYRAKDETQAHLFANALAEAGIKAEIQGTSSHWSAGTGGPLFGGGPTWWGAPRIVVSAADAEKARSLVLDLEERELERAQPAEGGPEIEVACDECGEKSRFAASLRGTVQECPNCGEYVDVGEDDKVKELGAEAEATKEEE